MNTYQELSILAIMALILFFVAVPYCYVVYTVFLDWLEAVFGPVVRKLRQPPKSYVVHTRQVRRRNLSQIRSLAQP